MTAVVGMDPRVDRVRGLLAIGVMLGHTCDIVWTSVSPQSGMIFGIIGNTRPLLGFVCVIGFIVLSGYCIARSTMKAERFNLGRYAFLRITRLYPLLIVATLAAGVVEWLVLQTPHRTQIWHTGQDVGHFLYAMAGLSGFQGQFGSLAPSYTISYELFYYLVWGLALTVTAGRLRLALLLAGAGAAVLLAFGDPIRARVGVEASKYLHPLSVALLPAWLIGAGLAIFFSTIRKAVKFVPVWAAWLVAGIYFTYGWDYLKQPSLESDAPALTYYIIISALFAFAMATWLSREAEPETPLDRWLGEISYPLFLIHGPTIVGLQVLFKQLGWAPPFDITLVVFVATNLGAATLLAICVERPVMAWRRRLRDRELQRQKSIEDGKVTSAPI